MVRISVVMLVLSSAACVTDDIPRNGSGADCQDPSQCPIAACDCRDGTVVLAQHCISFHCQTADDACFSLCDEHGGWTRRDAGEFFCSSDDACPALSCTCTNGETFDHGFCNTGVCARSEDEACYGACLDAGGYMCSPPGDSCFEKGCCSGFCDDNGTCVGDEGGGRPPGR